MPMSSMDRGRESENSSWKGRWCGGRWVFSLTLIGASENVDFRELGERAVGRQRLKMQVGGKNRGGRKVESGHP